MLRAFRGFPVCLSLFTCTRSVRSHIGGEYALLLWSGGGHHAAELGCGRLRRCPVIRPAADRRMRDTPYDRRRALTAAYRAGACLSLDGCRAVPSQRLLQNCSFLICAELIAALFLFFCGIAALASAATKIVSKNAGRIFLPFRLHTILPAFAVLFNSDGRPVFPGGFILTYFGFLIRTKSC